MQQSKFITKCDKLLLQSASGITKCDRLLLQSASGITKCDRLHYKDSCYNVRRNNFNSVQLIIKYAKDLETLFL